MLKKTLTLITLAGICASYSFAQTYVPAAFFDYDGVGNRVKRYMATFCLTCPKMTSQDTTKVIDTIKHITDAGMVQTIIEAYPNPTEQNLFIDNRTWKKSDKAAIIVLDMNGKTVLQRELKEANNTVPFRDLVPGTYIVQYYLNDKLTQGWKIIKL